MSVDLMAAKGNNTIDLHISIGASVIFLLSFPGEDTPGLFPKGNDNANRHE